MLFENWAGLGRVLLVGTLAYAALVLFLRISGKRTLSKMNAFDLVVTVALGSSLATTLLTSDVALLEGLLAFALLIGLQWVVAWGSVRSAAFRGLIKAEPMLLVHNGQMLEGAMRRERVAPDEILAAIRAEGYADLSKIDAVVLETDGTFSVIAEADNAQAALEKVKSPRSAP